MQSTADSGTLVCPAPAKLNLFLHVVGRRGDGYHLLQSVLRFLDYGDTLHFSLRGDGGVQRVTGVPGVSAEQDLTLRAARLLQRASGTGLGADIALHKRVPLGGGLGGGSSDAATALIALNRLWGLAWPRARLQELALQLGADVPVFVFGRSAFAEGVGEQLRAVELAPAWYVVLVPPVSVSTATVFADPELTRNSDPIKIHGFSAGANGLSVGPGGFSAGSDGFSAGSDGFSAGPGRNDLEAVVCRQHEEVARHLGWLRQFGPAAMTGSGACVFAAFDTEPSAQQIFRRRPAGMHGFVARGLDRHPLWEWLA
jgi:4-diphosphocytidyl-2-C-methyl-D-erythritol kinase